MITLCYPQKQVTAKKLAGAMFFGGSKKKPQKVENTKTTSPLQRSLKIIE